MFPKGFAALLLGTLATGLVRADPGIQQPGTAARHAAKVAAAKAGNHDLLLVGDSITENLDKPAYKDVWNHYFAPRNALDLGYSGGRTENILWNLQNGELDGQSPKAITLLIGTNDTDDANYPVAHTPEQVAEGTAAIVKLLRERCPDAKILLLRIFPRTNIYKNKDGSERGNSTKRFEANLRAGELVAKLVDDQHVFFLDVNHVFYKLDGTLDAALLPDLLHPSPAGAVEWAKEMEPVLASLIGDKPVDVQTTNTAVVPVSKLEKDGYDWFERHNAILKLADDLKPEIVLIGDSITHFWDGAPQSAQIQPRGPLSFEQTFSGKRVINLGFGWDRTQNVLWRLDHSELDGIHAKWVVLNIGSNNFAGTQNARVNTPAEIADGIREIVLRVRAKSPGSKIVITGVFPFGKAPEASKREPVNELNKLLAETYKEVPGIFFLDVNSEARRMAAFLRNHA